MSDDGTQARNSIASSRAVPSNWGDSQYFEDEDELDGQRTPRGGPAETSGLMRQASVGKQFKPTLTTVKSSNTMDREFAADESKLRSRDGNTNNNINNNLGVPEPSILISPPTSAKRSPNATVTDVRSRALTPEPPVDPRVKQILGGLEKGGAIQDASNIPLTPFDPSTFKEPSQRASTTSLPDLIRRATRLASNLDRGKTASRLGIKDMLASSSKKNEKNRTSHPYCILLNLTTS
jgi:hypothetical protein